ncbi:MAG TPA: hypothetical protein VIL20_22595 [Sandaracinaceae bacterium]
MRRPILAISILLASCGAVRDTVTLATPGEPLRLARVVLYQNGLAHFERRGRADGDTIDLRVPAAQVDDVLRTLTVVDGAEAAITGVRMLPADREEDVVLRVGLASSGTRDLRVTYVTELPGFRPTYRLVGRTPSSRTRSSARSPSRRPSSARTTRSARRRWRAACSRSS